MLGTLHNSAHQQLGNLFAALREHGTGMTTTANSDRHRAPATQTDFPHFTFKNGELHCEDVPASRIAEQFGTSAYVYSKRALEGNLRALTEAFSPVNPLICFSVKCLNNIHVLRLLADQGCGMDIVSGGELFRALRAGVDPARIVYAGVGKMAKEINEALAAGVGWINVESAQELALLAQLSQARAQPVNCALRINPDMSDSQTHQKTFTASADTKFGIDMAELTALAVQYKNHPFVRLRGLHFHLGSPIYAPELYGQAIGKLLGLVETFAEHGVRIDTLDIGGGFCAVYGDEKLPSIESFAAVALPLLRPFAERGGQIILEPGRSIAATAGVLLSKVLYTKRCGSRQFAVLDAGMSHLIRPALYDAFHFIWPTRPCGARLPQNFANEPNGESLVKYDVVGPICETGDLFARDRWLPPVEHGELIAFFSCGAYGMTMASHYNAVGNPVEVLVDESECRLIRRREQYADLVRQEELS